MAVSLALHSGCCLFMFPIAEIRKATQAHVCINSLIRIHTKAKTFRGGIQ